MTELLKRLCTDKGWIEVDDSKAVGAVLWRIEEDEEVICSSSTILARSGRSIDDLLVFPSFALPASLPDIARKFGSKAGLVGSAAYIFIG